MSRARFDSSPKRKTAAGYAKMIDPKAVEEWLGQKKEELDDKGDDAFDQQVVLLCTNQQLIILYFIGEDLRTDSGDRVLPDCATCRWLFFL